MRSLHAPALGKLSYDDETCQKIIYSSPSRNKVLRIYFPDEIGEEISLNKMINLSVSYTSGFMLLKESQAAALGEQALVYEGILNGLGFKKLEEEYPVEVAGVRAALCDPPTPKDKLLSDCKSIIATLKKAELTALDLKIVEREHYEKSLSKILLGLLACSSIGVICLMQKMFKDNPQISCDDTSMSLIGSVPSLMALAFAGWFANYTNNNSKELKVEREYTLLEYSSLKSRPFREFNGQ